MEKNFLCDILTAESSMATSGAFEASVVLVAWERCHAKKHQTLTGFPCVICEDEVRREFLTRRKTKPLTLSETERERIRTELGLV